MSISLSRRRVLQLLGLLATGSALGVGCGPEPMEETPYFDGLIDVPRVGRPRNEANVRALMDCLLPRDDDSPGAL